MRPKYRDPGPSDNFACGDRHIRLSHERANPAQSGPLTLQWRMNSKSLAALTCLLFVGAAAAQSPVQSCNTTPPAPFCSAVSGDRSHGWLTQHRSEVMARNGVVATSQPLAAQAGLDILRR